MTETRPMSESTDHSPRLSAFNFTDASVQEKPNAFYRALRSEEPVHFEKQLGMYLVSKHEDLTQVFRDPVTFSMEKGYYSQFAHGYLDELKSILIENGGGWFPDVVNVDPPHHVRTRALMQQAFTARRMKSLEPKFEALVDRLIDAFFSKGQMDGLAELALPMAIGFAKGQLNVTDLEQETIRKWGAAYLSMFSLLESQEHMESMAKELCDLQNYLIELVQSRIAEPGEDMLSDLIAARIDREDGRLTFEELVATARAILINTHDSVSTALVNILYEVATNREIADEFYSAAEDDKRMAKLVEEILRLEPPVRAMSRMTTKPVRLGEVDLPEGAHLLLLFASGNDDESIFPHAREFDLGRQNLVQSLSFGAGSHLCLGISLARMQLRVAAMKAAQRLKNLRLAVPVEDIRIVPNVALLAKERLPLRFDQPS